MEDKRDVAAVWLLFGDAVLLEATVLLLAISCSRCLVLVRGLSTLPKLFSNGNPVPYKNV